MKPDALTSDVPQAADTPAATSSNPLAREEKPNPAQVLRVRLKEARSLAHSTEMRSVLALEQIADELTLIREHMGVTIPVDPVRPTKSQG